MKALRNLLSLLLAVVLGSGILYAQPLHLARTDIREKVRASRMLAAGLDRTYDTTVKALTPAPKGYKATYIAHYGRHGSRYAYTAKTYTLPLEMLREGAAAGNLTEYGQKLLGQMEAFWKEGQYKVGDLTPAGWKQHAWIAANMVKSFPDAFKAGSRVEACSSTSVRSIMSMSSCCAGIAREAPMADVYAHSGTLDIQATRPNMGKNPFAYTGPALPFPFAESSEEYFLRKFPQYPEVLGRLFKDPSVCLGGRSAYDVFFYLYMLVAGMNSIPPEERLDLDPLLTDEEYAILWETDNYERFREYYPYKTTCCSIVDDMVAKADARLASGSTGADLRFGHDHVLMSLLMVMDVNGAGLIAPTPEEQAYFFQTTDSPMATNIQLVFYTPKCKKRGGETLVKLLLNGEEATFNLISSHWPYYKWSELKAYLQQRTDWFVNY